MITTPFFHDNSALGFSLKVCYHDYYSIVAILFTSSSENDPRQFRYFNHAYVDVWGANMVVK